MPPKMTKEQQLKLLKKERDDALALEKQWNAAEFARLEKAKQAYMEHWRAVAAYVAETEGNEKARLADEATKNAELLDLVRQRA